MDKEREIRKRSHLISSDAFSGSIKRASSRRPGGKGVRESLALLDLAIEEFNNALADIEKRYDPKNTEALLEETSEAIYKACEICRTVDEDFRDDTHILQGLRQEFRLRTDPLFSKGYFMKYARTWPKGYPGDYKIIEGVYRNMAQSDGLGKLLDLHFLKTTLALAVRHRREHMRDLLREAISMRTSPRVLNVACGSCREVVELAPEISAGKAHFTCIDFDEDALGYAGDRLAVVGISQQVELKKYNALKMISYERNLKEFGLRDIIYSIGFFDYIADDILIKMLGSLYKLLNPGGLLIAAFKDSRKYETQEYHWFVDWAGFYQRTEEESASILEKAGIPLENVTRSRDASGVIIFYRAIKG